ncbi:MAG TPA: CoA-transferase [Candidatus Limnocylindria bacterium]|nr:CoA-transferase [Candidatus Limnocylindria bacterium]
MTAATPEELMIAAAAAELAGVRTVFVGIGLPNAAANLARRSVAPDLELIYESGVVGARPTRLPDSIGDPALVSGAAATISMRDLFGGFLQGGRIEVGMLGAAQIDRWGNLNTTVIGPYDRPHVRLPGSGGACEIALNARRVIVVMDQSSRSFVERVDFVTSPGHRRPDGSGGRPAWAGAGPTAVVTQLGVYHFGADGEMELVGLHAGVDEGTVDAGTGWPMRRARPVAALEGPSPERLETIRRLVG